MSRSVRATRSAIASVPRGVISNAMLISKWVRLTQPRTRTTRLSAWAAISTVLREGKSCSVTLMPYPMHPRQLKRRSKPARTMRRNLKRHRAGGECLQFRATSLKLVLAHARPDTPCIRQSPIRIVVGEGHHTISHPMTRPQCTARLFRYLVVTKYKSHIPSFFPTATCCASARQCRAELVLPQSGSKPQSQRPAMRCIQTTTGGQPG
jgi:hypothetical protein